MVNWASNRNNHAGTSPQGRRIGRLFPLLAGLALALAPTEIRAQTWRGLTVAPEHRCSPYRHKDYSYPQSVEPRIVASLGNRIYGPYTGQMFSSIRQTDIEHIVARSEAHDSGLCRADRATKRRFASDLLNLTLASPRVNRHQKRHHDAAEWLPRRNRCWFAARVIKIRQAYNLTIDRREARVLESILSNCESTKMVFFADGPSQPAKPAPVNNALRRWDDNGNGRITCSEARRHGIAPVPRSHPAYRFMTDGDNDGVVCE